jgi:hypothetical protein
MAGSSASGCGCGRCRAQSGVAPAWESPSSRAVLEERSGKQRTSPSGSDRGGARVYDGALGVQSTAIPPGASTRANAVRRATATSLPTSIYSSTRLDRYCVSARPPLSISIEVVTITDSRGRPLLDVAVVQQRLLVHHFPQPICLDLAMGRKFIITHPLLS